MKRKEECFYNAKCKYYPNGTLKISVFSKPIYNPDGYELERDSRGAGSFGKYEMEEVRDDSVKRAKDKVFDIALANKWEYMITLTLDKNEIDRYDSKVVGKNIRKWLNNMQQRKGIKYLIIPEYHKDKAIHFHGLYSGNLTLIDSGIRHDDNRIIYNIENYKYGFSMVIQLNDDSINIAKYITKYITKDSQKIMGSFYFCGGSVIRDLPCDYSNMDYDEFEGIEYEIPNAGMKVKYATIGLL